MSNEVNSRKVVCMAMVMLLVGLVSESSPTVAQIFQPRIDAVPAGQLPAAQRSMPETRAVDPSRFRYSSRQPYTLDHGDVVGVVIDGVLGSPGESPPIYYPPAGSDVAPSLGYPFPVREDGTLSLPLIDPISVRGLTVPQIEALVKTKYTDPENPVLNERSRVLVSLMRKRTVSVFVVRGDNSQSFQTINAGRSNRSAVSDRSDRSGRIEKLQLPVGDNDLLNALSQTGGLPGVNAKSDIRIFRGGAAGSESANGNRPFSRSKPFPRSTMSNSTLGAYNSNGQLRSSIANRNPSVVPTRTRVGYRPAFDPMEARLNQNDVVVIDSRETEVYFTGGLLRGGQYLLPRDQSLDVLEAVAIAGGQPGNNASPGGLPGLPQRQPTELIVLRKLPNGSQLPIRVNMQAALSDPSQRIAVQPGDFLMLRYSRGEQIQNAGIGVFNAYGIRSLLGR